MGWCSGTVLFDTVCDALLADKKPSSEQIIRILAIAMENMDWDCQQDSKYFDHPVVRKIMMKMHPDWDWND